MFEIRNRPLYQSLKAKYSEAQRVDFCNNQEASTKRQCENRALNCNQ